MATLQIPQGAAALNYLKGLPKAEGVVDIGDHIRGQVQPCLRVGAISGTGDLLVRYSHHLCFKGLPGTTGRL
jgi:hypothetical protein